MIVLPPIITIDGPSGVGKGELCRALSTRLKWNILDSGAIYRVLALEASLNDVPIYNSNSYKDLMELASDLDITFVNNKLGLCVFFRGKDVTREIYTETIGNFASKIAIFPEIRNILLQYQRDFHIFPGLVANGRDMGTVVFPNATLKVFLDASFKVRCERRFKQLKKKGINVSLDYLLTKIKERDNRDYTRKIAPLIPAKNSLIFNSNYFSVNEIVSGVLKCFYSFLFYD